MMPMNAGESLQLLLSRRSTRRFKTQTVPEDLITQVIEAGRYAPSGGNSQTTHFIVITDPCVLSELACRVQDTFVAMTEQAGMYRSIANAIRASHKGDYIFHYNAPVLILTANQRDYGNNIADCACALENMMLMANALDLGSCWINQLRWLNEDPSLLDYLKTLGLQENERVWGALALGYADTENGLPVREPLLRTGNPVTWIPPREEAP